MALEVDIRGMVKKILDIIPPKSFKERTEVESEERSEKEEKWAEEKPKKRLIFAKILIPVLVFLISLFILFQFVLAKVEITIFPETENLDFEEKISIDTKINQLDSKNKIITGITLEAENTASQKFSASGKSLKEEKARGKLLIYNNYHLGQVLVQNTRFQPPQDRVLYFRSTKKVIVPAKSSVDVEVMADRSGPDYNIGPATFSIPGLAGLPQYYSIYAKSSLAMTGGFSGEVRQVTQQDLNEAEINMTEKLKKESEKSLKSKISGDFILLTESISQEIIEATSTLSAGKEGDSFDFKVKIKTKAISFEKSDLDKLVQEFIYSKITGTNKKIQTESLKINYSPESIKKEEGKIILNLRISAKNYSDIDLSALKKDILGKSLTVTKNFLENKAQITKVNLKVFPFWLKSIPREEKRIKANLKVD